MLQSHLILKSRKFPSNFFESRFPMNFLSRIIRCCGGSSLRAVRPLCLHLFTVDDVVFFASCFRSSFTSFVCYSSSDPFFCVRPANVCQKPDNKNYAIITQLIQKCRLNNFRQNVYSLLLLNSIKRKCFRRYQFSID